MDSAGLFRQSNAQNLQGRLNLSALFFTLMVCVVLIQPHSANASTANNANSPSLSPVGGQKKNVSKTAEATKPEWTDLTPSQKAALLPLRENWHFLGDASKRKWIALSNNYQSMALAEQYKLHARMNEWVALSQQQRVEARLNFSQAKLLPKSHKSATWEAYQALSPEDKNKLARVEKEKKTASSAISKNSPGTKLTTPPVKILARQPKPNQVAANLILDRQTLLLRAYEFDQSPPKN